jgi:site-specific recombinase XerD
MRMENLSGLLLDQHFDRVGPDTIHVVIDRAQVKNKKDLTYQLSPSVVHLLDLYVSTYRPLLLGRSNSSALFVSRNGRQKDPAQLGNQITKLIRQETGLEVNPHLFRHLAGYLFLEAHPGQYEPVRQLLGHKDIQTTIDFYCGLETADTLRRYDQILSALRPKERIDG